MAVLYDSATKTFYASTVPRGRALADIVGHAERDVDEYRPWSKAARYVQNEKGTGKMVRVMHAEDNIYNQYLARHGLPGGQCEFHILLGIAAH